MPIAITAPLLAALLLGGCATLTSPSNETIRYCRQVAVENQQAAENWPTLSAEQQRAAIKRRDESRAVCGK